MTNIKNLISPEITFPFTEDGIKAMRNHKYWYQRKETYKLVAMTIAYVAIVAVSASTGSVASMGSVEDSLIKAFFTKPPVGL